MKETNLSTYMILLFDQFGIMYVDKCVSFISYSRSVSNEDVLRYRRTGYREPALDPLDRAFGFFDRPCEALIALI
jgi:hypothetical protein